MKRERDNVPREASAREQWPSFQKFPFQIRGFWDFASGPERPLGPQIKIVARCLALKAEMRCEITFIGIVASQSLAPGFRHRSSRRLGTAADKWLKIIDNDRRFVDRNLSCTFVNKF
jgi:hypothetical protein